MHTKCADLFAVAKPIVSKLQVMRWSTLAKHSTVPQFLKENFKSCRTLFPEQQMQKIIDAGDNWVGQCATEVVALQKCGPLGEAMFDKKLKDLVSNKLHQKITDMLQDLARDSAATGVVLDEEAHTVWRDKIQEGVEADVESLKLLASKRCVAIPYRNGEIAAVPVSCVTDQIDFSIIALFKSVAIEAKHLHALDAEVMMGYRCGPLDASVKVKSDFFEKQAACL